MPERYLGRTLGRFRIEAIIGSGGFAWVYKGYDPELEIPVAIKVLKPQYAGEETFETRFRREASTAAKLRHPNIIRILAVGREEQAVYFVMDYLPTGLDDRLRIMGTLPESLLIRLGMDVSAALAFAHREGVIHRDIKTDNILFDEHGNAIVADFGIARAVSGYIEQTGTNMVVGTPQYFSPEQARGQPLDGRADIYSLGVTLFKAATGVLPFQGDDWYDIARQHVEETPPKPRAFNPALSRGVERVILKCLEKNPANRYPTGDALHTELVQLLGKAALPEGDATIVLPTPLGGTPAQAEPARTPARWPTVLSAAAAILIAALIATTLRMRSAPRSVEVEHVASTPGAAMAAPPPPSSAPVSRDSAAAEADSIQRPVPAPAVAESPPELRVDVPDGAAVRVDGHLVAHGDWHTRKITAGRHTISATMASVPGCPTATQSRTVRVTAGDPTIVALAPRPCGKLTLDVLPAGARWAVSSREGDEIAHGIVPSAAPAPLPVGSYVLHISKRLCADWSAPITISTAERPPERVRLICP
ncbi:MAG TPA: serine/threonine-protein kinase [Gemmatimonadaceae bacterium]|nr:serine/threonine-protein kinase [Gemmatimonadaceae bacterium]